MRIEWLGHACFLITASDGTKILTDPYDPSVGYRDIGVDADVVTVSHAHYDHNYVSGVGGSPEVVDGPGKRTVKGIEFLGVEAFHDTSGGAQRGRNTIFAFEVDGLRVCHLGDLGHPLTEDQRREIGEVDVLLVPVGGYFTIGPKEAWEVIEQLKPKVVIPMHFKTPSVSLPISPVDEFLSGKPNVRRLGKSEVELTKESLPAETEVWVLEPSRG
ncbi:MAG TPA: MBL fold metallo-hydrolase [Armatimonadetes bacterium]|nr:MBL fold metallo-hydrolase [Armatimonadota bacterium]